MYRSDQPHMLDDMFDHPKDIFVSSRSKHAALISTGEDNAVLLTGDFSGNMKENEAEVRRAMKDWPFGRRR